MSPDDAVTLPITGERTGPRVATENYWFRRHEIAYRWAIQQLSPAAGWVLDAGSGEGYGTAMLAAAGHRACGVDYDRAAVAHTSAAYDLPAVRGNLVALPLATAACSAVVSLQVVEHLWDQAAYVGECARVLQPGGRCIVSTPNRLTFSPGWQPGDRPVNLFHTVELTATDLAGLLAASFTDVRLYGVHHGPRLPTVDTQVGGLVRAQLAEPPDRWPRALMTAVERVTADDFVVVSDSAADPIGRSLDLVAVATR